MTKIISLVNHKGGVGKTTTTLNLGKALSIQGKKVLVVDLDPQSNLSQSIGIKEATPNIYDVLCGDMDFPVLQITDNFFITPSSLNLATAEMKLQAEHVTGYTKLKKSLDKIRKNYDYVLIDCPPSLGLLTINGLTSATEIIIVCEPEYLSITGLQTIIDLYEKVKDTFNSSLSILGLLFTQYNRTVINKGIIKSIRDSYGNKVFETIIRENVKVAEASIHKKDVFSYDNKSIGAEDYMNLSKEVIGHE